MSRNIKGQNSDVHRVAGFLQSTHDRAAILFVLVISRSLSQKKTSHTYLKIREELIIIGVKTLPIESTLNATSDFSQQR